jgi:hypothetical protein
MKSFKAHTLFIITISITIVHFILTTIVGHYIAVQIGSSMGQVIANELIKSIENPKSSEKEINERVQAMKTKGDEMMSRWKIPLLLISLPIKPVIQPLLNEIRRVWMYEPAVSKELSKDQFKTRASIISIIDTVITGLNSLAFGLLIWLVELF